MKTRLGRTFRREKRRLTTLVVLAFLSGALLYANAGESIGGLPTPLFVGAIYAGLLGPAAFVVFVLLPAQAAVVEAMAVARFGVALAVTWLPGPGAKVLENPLVMSTIVIFCGLVTHLLLRRLKSENGRLTIRRTTQLTGP